MSFARQPRFLSFFPCQRESRGRILGFAAYIAAAAAILALTVAAYGWAWRWAGLKIQQEARDRLAIYEISLEAAIERYRHLPEVLALAEPVRALLDDPENSARIDLTNRHLRAVARSAGADTLFVMNAGGLTIASSNFDEPISFVGQNYAFRPYFQHAIEQGSGRYFAVGATSGRPGYFLATRIDGPDGILGVAVVKVDLSPLEKEWRRAGDAVALLDNAGIVFFATREDWLYRPLTPLTKEAIVYLEQTRKYGSPPMLRETLSRHATGLGRLSYLEIAPPKGESERFFDLRRPLPDHGWEILHLVPVRNADAVAGTAAIIMAMLALAGILGAVILRQKRAHARLRKRAHEELERRVEERTHALATTNARLVREVREREMTENALRKAQDGLVQSAKLAGLGQGLAGIAHEIAQPLAALRVSLASLRHFIAHGEEKRALATARDLGSIVERVERLAAQFRNFARPAPEKPRVTALQDVVAGALSLVEHRLQGTGIALERDMPAAPVLVEARVNRLEQVIVNLMTNAIDASREASRTDEAPRRIRLVLRAGEGRASLSVEDEGIGLGETVPEALFEPFVSSKATGEGLGLGLSISRGIMREHRGELTLSQRPEGGAVATLNLPLAQAEQAA